MAERKDGGPAFPRRGNDHEEGAKGMTLRDYFAGQAMQATLGSDTAVSEIMAADMDADRSGLAKAVAAIAYLFADAMLAERSR
jgi:hypothetical protein